MTNTEKFKSFVADHGCEGNCKNCANCAKNQVGYCTVYGVNVGKATNCSNAEARSNLVNKY